METVQNTQYFAVVYLRMKKVNSIHLMPGKDKEDCLNKLRELRDDPEWGPRIDATTVIKRDMSNFKDGRIFGCPNSLNVLNEKKKKSKNN